MMFVPGRILHCIKTDVAVVDVSGSCLRAVLCCGLCPTPRWLQRGVSALFRVFCCVRTRRVYVPRWADRNNFVRLLVSADMVRGRRRRRSGGDDAVPPSRYS